jgi:hypothetical protein
LLSYLQELALGLWIFHLESSPPNPLHLIAVLLTLEFGTDGMDGDYSSLFSG